MDNMAVPKFVVEGLCVNWSIPWCDFKMIMHRMSKNCKKIKDKDYLKNATVLILCTFCLISGWEVT